MCPVLLEFGFIKIYSYGFMVALAFLVCGFLLSKYFAKLGLGGDFVWNLLFWIILGGLIGGRLLYVLLNFNFYLGNPGELLMLWHGGLVWYGGFGGGIVSGLLYLKKNNLRILKILDLMAPFIALGQSIGRIGCLLNGCCYGKAARGGLYFPVYNEYLIPTQAFSSLALIIIFIILKMLQERPHQEGLIFIYYLLLCSIKRFIIEFLRNDSARIYIGLTIFQIISLFIFIGAVCALVVIKKKYWYN